MNIEKACKAPSMSMSSAFFQPTTSSFQDYHSMGQNSPSQSIFGHEHQRINPKGSFEEVSKKDGNGEIMLLEEDDGQLRRQAKTQATSPGIEQNKEKFSLIEDISLLKMMSAHEGKGFSFILSRANKKCPSILEAHSLKNSIKRLKTLSRLSETQKRRMAEWSILHPNANAFAELESCGHFINVVIREKLQVLNTREAPNGETQRKLPTEDNKSENPMAIESSNGDQNKKGNGFQEEEYRLSLNKQIPQIELIEEKKGEEISRLPTSRQEKRKKTETPEGASMNSEAKGTGREVLGLDKTSGSFAFKFENTIDSAQPLGFDYTSSNIDPRNLLQIKPSDLRQCCQCTGECASDPDCLCMLQNTRLQRFSPYKFNPKTNQKSFSLPVEEGTRIFECNARCSCRRSCSLRCINDPRQVHIKEEEDFIVKRVHKERMGNGATMWGLFTEKPIDPGRIAIEYVGEVLMAKDADKRGHFYDHINLNYLFELNTNMEIEEKFSNKKQITAHVDGFMVSGLPFSRDGTPFEKKYPFSIDGFFCGNLARFINHSCDPNLQPVNIHTESHSIFKSRVFFFAKRKIQAGEELTFNYNFSRVTSGKQFHCFCNSKNCSGFMNKS